MQRNDRWRLRLSKLGAMAELGRAQLLIRMVPFKLWRAGLGLHGTCSEDQLTEAGKLAAITGRAAALLPFPIKCLPQAMVLSWALQRHGVPHAVIFAVRPARLRESPDALHAWVEVEGSKILGDLPEPWIETLRLGG